MQNILDYNFKDKRVLLRVDYNVPLSKEGTILDNSRIKLSLETIKKILSDGGSVVLISHLGNPKGQRDKDLSLLPIAKELESLLDKKVVLHDLLDPISIKDDIVLLENIRFYKEEELCDVDFAKHLATFGDVFVFEAFSVSHRDHASVSLLPKFFNDRFLGLHVQKELTVVNKFLHSPARPFSLVIGGNKIFDKLNAIYKLLPKVDNLIVGGGIANTFLKIKDGEIGKSVVEDNKREYFLDLIDKAKFLNVNIVEPLDFIVIKNVSDESLWPEIANRHCVETDHIILDIGPKTQKVFYDIIAKSQSVIWSGPMGFVENNIFAKGSEIIAEGILKVVKNGGCSLIGGGDTGAFIYSITQNGEDYGFISSGGTALLSYIAESSRLAFVNFDLGF